MVKKRVGEGRGGGQNRVGKGRGEKGEKRVLDVVYDWISYKHD